MGQNPAMAGFAEARHIYGDADYLVVSIGTGDRQDHLKYEQVKNWGLAQWAREIAPVFMDSTSEAADQELHFILGSQRHFRFQADLKSRRTIWTVLRREYGQPAEGCRGLHAKNASRLDEVCVCCARVLACKGRRPQTGE